MKPELSAKALRAGLCALVCIVGIVSFPDCSRITEPESLTNISRALNLPHLGTNPPMNNLENTQESRAACETINGAIRLSNAVLNARTLLCIFGAAEDAKLITKGTSGYNYYELTPPGSNSPLVFRYGIYKGNLHANGCLPGSGQSIQEVEVGDKIQAGAHQITATQDWSWSNVNVRSQTILTDDGSFNVSTASMVTAGTNVSGFVTLSAGNTGIVTENWSANLYPAWQVGLYSAYNNLEGSTLMSGIYTAGSVESWKNDTSYACVSPATSGSEYSAVTSPSASIPGANSTTVQFQDEWDCSIPSGSTATVLPNDNTAFNTQVQSCLAQSGFGTPSTEHLCSAIQSACP